MSDMNTPQHSPAPTPEPEAASMTTAETLTGIFFEPGRTFEALRQRPRFLVASVVILVATLAFVTLLYQRISYESIVRQSIENNPRMAEMDPAQKEQMIAMQTGPVFKALAYCTPVIGIAIFVALGGLLYWLGSMAMGKAASYKQAISVWVYSSLPPSVFIMVANILLLFLKAQEDINPETASRGLVRANLGVLADPTTSPVLATALGVIDIFALYGLVLAAIGLRKVARLSSGAAWTIVLVIWLVGVVLRIALAAAFGMAMA